MERKITRSCMTVVLERSSKSILQDLSSTWNINQHLFLARLSQILQDQDYARSCKHMHLGMALD
jgi:hypothetical protein